MSTSDGSQPPARRSARRMQRGGTPRSRTSPRPC